MCNDNNLAINRLYRLFDELDPIVKRMNDRYNLLEEHVKSEVVKFNNEQIRFLTRMPIEDRGDYFDVEINKLNFKIRKAEQNYNHDEVKLLKALWEELQFFSENHSCIEYKRRIRRRYILFFLMLKSLMKHWNIFIRL